MSQFLLSLSILVAGYPCGWTAATLPGEKNAHSPQRTREAPLEWENRKAELEVTLSEIKKARRTLSEQVEPTNAGRIGIAAVRIERIKALLIEVQCIASKASKACVASANAFQQHAGFDRGRVAAFNKQLGELLNSDNGALRRAMAATARLLEAVETNGVLEVNAARDAIASLVDLEIQMARLCYVPRQEDLIAELEEFLRLQSEIVVQIRDYWLSPFPRLGGDCLQEKK